MSVEAKKEMPITKDSEGSNVLLQNLSSGMSLALIANIFWGMSFLASKYTVLAWGPFTSSSLRFGIAVSILFLILKLLGKKIEIPSNKIQFIALISIGTTAYGFLYPMQLAGLKFIPSSLAAAIMLTSPLFVLILGRIVLQEKLSKLKYVALSFGVFGGGVLIFSTSGISTIQLNSELVIGCILTLVSSFSLALSVIFTRKYSKNFKSASLTFWSMAIGFVELTLATLLVEKNAISSVVENSSPIAWLSLMFLALVCSAFCFFIWNLALAKASPQEIASSMHIKTPTAVLIGVVIAGESFTLPIIIGTILVTFGVWLSQQKRMWGIA